MISLCASSLVRELAKFKVAFSLPQAGFVNVELTLQINAKEVESFPGMW